MENFTKEDLSDAFNAGATRMYHDINLGNGNPPEFEQWFEKFSLYKNHPTTASGSAENMTKEQQFNLPPAAVFNLQQIALADDDMVKAPGAAEKYRFIARHILELFASIGSVAAPKEEGEWSFEKDPYGNFSQFYQNKDFKFKALIRLPGTLCDQLNELTSLRQQLEQREEELTILYQDLNEREAECKTLKEGIRKGSELYANLKFDDEPTGYQIALKKIQEREEALKELLPIAESGKAYHTNAKAIIERARKLISK